MRKPEDGIDRIVSVLLRGGRLKLGAGDIDEKAAIIVAARLAATRGGPAHMRPAFRRHLVETLEATPKEWLVTRRSALVAGLGLAAGMATGGLVAQASQATTDRAYRRRAHRTA
jgi:hypothetical protein